MNDDTGVDYVSPWEVGQAVRGFCGVGVVFNSRSPDYSRGDVLFSAMGWPWMRYFIPDDLVSASLSKVPDRWSYMLAYTLIKVCNVDS